MAGVDPFALWSAASDRPTTSPTPEKFARRPPVRLAQSKPRSRREPAPTQFGRRKLLTLLAAGTAGVITVVTIGGISLARSPESTKPSPLEIDDGHGSTARSTSTTRVKERDRDRDGDRDEDRDGKWPHKKPTPSGSPTANPTSSPTRTPQPSPTSQPTQTQTPTTPTPTGTVIGSTTQATNSAMSFTNPADGQGSLLIHLPNGKFVACERACTHQGAWVNYNTTSGQLVCPAHGAIFDPTNGCSHVSGPGSGPLANVAITVNANGTITTG
jgi:Rieske Fe-S protein